MKDKFIQGIIIGLLAGLILGSLFSFKYFDRYQISEDGRTKIDKISGQSCKLKYSYGDPHREEIK